MPLSAAMIPRTMQTSAYPGFPNNSTEAGRLTLIFRVRLKAQPAQSVPGLTPDILHEHRLVLMPASMTQETEVRTSLFYTKSGLVAETAVDNPLGVTLFQISGHTGFGGVRAEGLGNVESPATPLQFLTTVRSTVSNLLGGIRGTAHGSAAARRSLIDGAAAIKDLQDTINMYFFPRGYDDTSFVTRTQDLQLEFLNLAAPLSAQDLTSGVGWVIHPHRGLVSVRQDATRPFLYFYQLQFAGVAPLAAEVPDFFVPQFTNIRTGFQRTLDQITQVVRDVTNGVSTITDAFDQMVIQQFTGPINNFLLASAQLGDALGAFIQSGADKLNYPLYALRLAGSVLDPVQHSVTSLRAAAVTFADTLARAADPRSLGALGAFGSLTAGLKDTLRIALNAEEPVTLSLGTQTSGGAVAAEIQAQVRALTPQHAANASAYRDFTAVFDAPTQQYALFSGTKLSNSGRVEVLVPDDPGLFPTDASGVLRLGVPRGGQEHAGSAYPAPAIALLRGMEEACTHLLAFPEYFADQLEQQDARLTTHFSAGSPRVRLQGDQHLQQVRSTPGESLQGFASRVGVAWETLALVNRLTYPYLVEQPTTLVRGRVSHGDLWLLADEVQDWPIGAYQGQRVDIVGGAGAGQSRGIVHNTATTLTLASAWHIPPNSTSEYAIRRADNPIVQTSRVTSATARTLTDSTLTLIDGSQRGLTIQVIDGPAAGERQRIASSSHATYTFGTPWRVVPPAGSRYVVLGVGAASPPRQKVIGDMLVVPRPTGQRPLPIRTRLSDTSAVTGKSLTQEAKLFSRDWVLTPEGRLVFDQAAGDAVPVAGLANLRQALINLVNLPLGELEYFPSLGSYVNEELGLSAHLPLQAQLLSSVERTIKQDARIARMHAAQLVTQGGNVLISFGATAINGAALERITIR